IAAGRRRIAEHIDPAARYRGGLFGSAAGLPHLGLLCGLLHRHLRDAAADTSHRPHTGVRVLYRVRGLHRAVVRVRDLPNRVVDTPAADRDRAGRAVRDHRELAQCAGARRKARRGVRDLHGGEPVRIGARPATAANSGRAVRTVRGGRLAGVRGDLAGPGDAPGTTAAASDAKIAIGFVVQRGADHRRIALALASAAAALLALAAIAFGGALLPEMVTVFLFGGMSFAVYPILVA